MNEYKTTVGIEVHAELNTKSKMFCGCKNEPHHAEPNLHICPVCTAQPGTQPSVNKEAVKQVLLVGKAIGGGLADYSEFDRKNYFYPDIPKAYQISQYAYPLVSGGELAGVEITRIHLEEDTAKSQHGEGSSLVDFNRAGVPLMELVTEPVIHDAKTAGDFARELQLLLRTLGVSDANMEKGEMRIEANISVSKTDQLGTKVEVKNLNSFKVVEQAIEFETNRQIKALESDEEIRQETRGWDEAKGATYAQRSKETAMDYRYFPDPDIPKYVRSEIEEFSDSRLSEILPKLAPEIRSEYRDLGLKEETIEVLLFGGAMREFYDEVRENLKDPKIAATAANYITVDLQGSDTTVDFGDVSDAGKKAFAELMELVAASEITSRVAKDLLFEVLESGVSPREIAEDKGLLQKNSKEDLVPIVEEIVAANETVVADYKAGKETAIKYLVGQGMKATKGSANPLVLEEVIKELLTD